MIDKLLMFGTSLIVAYSASFAVTYKVCTRPSKRWRDE